MLQRAMTVGGGGGVTFEIYSSKKNNGSMCVKNGVEYTNSTNSSNPTFFTNHISDVQSAVNDDNAKRLKVVFSKNKYLHGKIGDTWALSPVLVTSGTVVEFYQFADIYSSDVEQVCYIYDSNPFTS